MMISALRLCPKCGWEIPADAPEGGCPGCLLGSGLRLLDEEAVAGVGLSAAAAYSAEAAAKAGSAKVDDSGHWDEPPREATKTERLAEMLGELGDYELLEEVGRGGQGVVFRARQKSLNRIVALKVISLGQWASKEHLKRFRREAEAAASLDHPGIVPIYDVGERDGSCYFTMKFVEGGQLDQVVRRTPISIRQAAELIAKVARTVHYAHEHGILHRDIKPGNVLLDKNGEPHLTDFGLARLLDAQSSVTRTIDVLGTPSYMAPEQAAGETTNLSKATDVYGLGAVLYQLLTGQPPFAGGTTYETIRLLRDTDPQPPRSLNPKIDRELSTICVKCLEKDPKRRYFSALALAEDLEHWLKHEPIQAKPSGLFTHARKWVRRNPSTAVLVTLLMTLAVGLSVSVWNRKPAVVVPKSVAVLPFENLSDDPNSAYFAEGIQEEILTRLASIADLKVISRTSTQRYQSKPGNLAEIAKQLGVANIVEGSVQKAGDQVRVNVQLINAQTDSHLWADTYDRKLTDIFGVESEIAKGIADALRAKLTGAEQRAIATRPTANPEAHLLYLKGAYFSNKRTGPDLQTAIEFFKEAISKDPNYALAYAGLADAWALFSLYGGEGPQETMPQAKAAARKAVELDDTLPEAHNSLGLVLALYDFDFAHSKREFERAIALNPNYATAHHQFGNLNLSMVGEFDRAIAEGKRALELDPLSLIINADLGQNFMLARRYHEAIDQLRKTLALDPRFYYARWTLGEALQMRGQLREAMAEYEKAAEITDDPHVMGMLAQGYAKIGQRDKALNLLSKLEQLSTHRHVGLFTFALAHMAVGDNEKAIDDLEQAYREHDPNIVDIKVEPLFDPLRGHPRFERLVAKVLGTAESKSPGQPIESKSIAVLPFENRSEDKSNAYFAESCLMITTRTSLSGIKFSLRPSPSKS